MTYGTVIGPARGLQLDIQERCIVLNHTGSTLALGSVVMFDLPNTQGETTNNETGSLTSGFYIVTSPVAGTASIGKGLFAFVTSLQDGTGLDTEEVEVCYRGIGNVLWDAAVDEGDAGSATTGRVMDAVVPVNSKVIGICLTDPGGAALGRTLFDGINGFGASAGT